MRYVFDFVAKLGPARFVFDAILASAAGIALLLAFILIRRAYSRNYFLRRSRRTLAIRQQWPGILDGSVPPEQWLFDPLDTHIVETILADNLEVASPQEAAPLLACLRSSGLLDMRIYESRTLRGWRRHTALVSLGRMRAPEAIPALAEALDDPQTETRIAAVSGLGRTVLPAAAEPILERLVQHVLRVPDRPVMNALLSCCRIRPAVLLRYASKADDRARPLLVRVLGEVATPDLDEDLLLLASDPIADVRASAARALAAAKPRLALTALSSLAEDTEWFVRLRAVVGLGDLEDPRAIPALVETLCDRNRYVRLRSAAALARLDGHLTEIVSQVTQKGDRYALHALVTELERSGSILNLVNALADPQKRVAAEQALLVALRAGTARLLVDALARHSQWRVRLGVARLLARSREARLAAAIEPLLAAASSPREQRLFRWVLRHLRPETAPGPILQTAPV